MKMTLGIVLVSFCLLFGGTAIAADQNELPPILASLDHSENVILLNDHSMAQIAGTSFDHPDLRTSIGVLKEKGLRFVIGIHVAKIKERVKAIKQRKAAKRVKIRNWLRGRFCRKPA